MLDGAGKINKNVLEDTSCLLKLGEHQLLWLVGQG